MKKFLLLFFACFPLITKGQVTEAQKQEALSAASKFCTLLTQFSNGRVTYLGNDKKIFELCSTPLISTYDDISSHKEVQLTSYLAQITKVYKNKLEMSFSTPIIRDSYPISSFEGILNFKMISGDLGERVYSLNRVNIRDIYIIIETKQSHPKIKRETLRQIIYSTKEKKIISFSNKQSSFLAYCKALDACEKGQYHESLKWCDKALLGERFTEKSDCANIALLSCLMIEDYNSYQKYTKYLQKDIKEVIECRFSLESAIRKDDEVNVFYCLNKLSTFDFPQQYKQEQGNFQVLLAQCYVQGTGCEKSQEKAMNWYREAIKNGSTSAGYFMYINYKNGDLYISDSELIYTLELSAEKGYIASYYPLAILYAKEGKIEQEGLWYKKGAEQGDLMGMIYYGWWLSSVKHNKQEALYWLKKAANNPKLSSYLADRLQEVEGAKTVEDIQQLVYKVEHNIPIPTLGSNVQNISQQSYTQAHATPSTTSASYTSHQSTTTTSTSSNNYRTKTQRGFNMPYPDEGRFGISVGYVQKQWAIKEDGVGETIKTGYWDDTKQLSGIQAGLRVEPLFKYGFGIDTGLYYEYYYSKSKPTSYDGIEFEPSISEHSLYLPVHLEYRFNFCKAFQLFFYGGIGLDYVLSAKIKTNDEDLSYDKDDAYENASLKKFNTSLEYGGGFRINGVQVNLTLTNGLLNIYKESDAEIKQSKNLMCNLSYMF